MNTANVKDDWDLSPSGGSTGIVSSQQHGRFRCYGMMELSAMDLSVDYIFRNALVANTPGVIGGAGEVAQDLDRARCGNLNGNQDIVVGLLCASEGCQCRLFRRRGWADIRP